jgi:TetR/AcrR family tetracycline transcriptional repressor
VFTNETAVRTQGVRPRVPLTAERVIDVATGIVDERGASALTMRGLAAQLGVSKSAVTWHVGDRPQLLALVGATWLGTIVPPPPSGDGDWSAWLTELAGAYRAAAHRHPHLARLAIDGVSAASVTGGCAVPEAVVAHLSARGVPDTELCHAYNAVMATTLGFVALELASGAAAAVAADPSALDEHQAPAIVAHLDRLRDEAFGLAPDAMRFDASFDYLIGLVADGISRRA